MFFETTDLNSSCMEEETEAQRGQETEPKSQSISNAELGLEPDSPCLLISNSMADASHYLPYIPHAHSHPLYYPISTLLRW